MRFSTGERVLLSGVTQISTLTLIVRLRRTKIKVKVRREFIKDIMKEEAQVLSEASVCQKVNMRETMWILLRGKNYG